MGMKLSMEDFVNGGRAPTSIQIDRGSVHLFKMADRPMINLYAAPPPPHPYGLMRHLRNRL